jgi:hypothetical protein
MSLIVQAGDGEATVKQLKMIHALGTKLGLTHAMLGNLSETMFRRTLSELGVAEASDLIDHLLTPQAWGEWGEYGE